MRVKSSQLIRSCGTMTDPAAETKVNRAVGRRAGALPARTTEALNQIISLRHRSVGRVFCSSSRLFHRDPKLANLTRTWYRLDKSP